MTLSTEEIFRKPKKDLITYVRSNPNLKNNIVGYSSMNLNSLKDAINSIENKGVKKVGERKKSAHSMAIKDLYAELKPKGFVDLSQHKDRLAELKKKYSGASLPEVTATAAVLEKVPVAMVDEVKVVKNPRAKKQV